MQGLATQSNLSIQRFTPQPPKQQPLYAELPFKLQAEGTYHDLGLFLDRISKFHRIINVSEIVDQGEAAAGADRTDRRGVVATTFVLQEKRRPPFAGSRVAKAAAAK